MPAPYRLRQILASACPLGRRDEDRADRGAESLGQADRDGVEQLAVRRERYAAGDVRVPQPRAVQVHGDARARWRRPAAPGSGPAAAPCRRRSCACSPRRSRRSTPGRARRSVPSGPAARSASRRPRSAGQERLVIPEKAAAAPSSARSTWASESASTSCPGLTSSRMPSWLARDPDGVKTPGLVPEQPGHRLLEPREGRVLAVDVVADLGRRPWPAACRRVGWVTVSLRRSTTRSSWRTPPGATVTNVTPASRPPGTPARGLLVVEPRVADRLVARGQGRVVDVARRHRGTR